MNHTFLAKDDDATTDTKEETAGMIIATPQPINTLDTKISQNEDTSSYERL